MEHQDLASRRLGEAPEASWSGQHTAGGRSWHCGQRRAGFCCGLCRRVTRRRQRRGKFYFTQSWPPAVRLRVRSALECTSRYPIEAASEGHASSHCDRKRPLSVERAARAPVRRSSRPRPPCLQRWVRASCHASCGGETLCPRGVRAAEAGCWLDAQGRADQNWVAEHQPRTCSVAAKKGGDAVRSTKSKQPWLHVTAGPSCGGGGNACGVVGAEMKTRCRSEPHSQTASALVHRQGASWDPGPWQPQFHLRLHIR